MAGGKGTRIASIADDIPKPMIRIQGKPVLEHQLNVLKSQGIHEATIVVGHLGSIIQEYFQDGKAYGMDIHYIAEKEPLGTAGALSYLRGWKEDILLLNGDIMFDIDIRRFYKWHQAKKAGITLFTHPNSHPFDSTLVVADEKGLVLHTIRREDTRTDYKNRVNAGIHLLSPRILDLLPDKPSRLDLDRDLIQKCIGKAEVYAYDSPEYVKDMGTPERYVAVCRDYALGRIRQKNLNHKQRAVFLDRDGTVNVYRKYIDKPEQLELLPEAAPSIQRLNESAYLTIIVTNQPVIARGACTFAQMSAIHRRLERLLGEQGAYVDDIFLCPHHPESGFEGEVKSLKITCTCRKPLPGMFFQAAEKYNIDLKNSYMIGDHDWDMQAGRAAGCRVIMAKQGLKNSMIDQILHQNPTNVFDVSGLAKQQKEL
ncbi:HAD-IIIA family hydrolase [Lachnospiraceae bacterium]|nr:HAD-IIIA family hydrolase [Lachnospiraceae bacterium]